MRRAGDRPVRDLGSLTAEQFGAIDDLIIAGRRIDAIVLVRDLRCGAALAGRQPVPMTVARSTRMRFTMVTAATKATTRLHTSQKTASGFPLAARRITNGT